MDDHDSSSSTGLVIGMIVGGVVVLVVLLLFALGAGFFFLRSGPVGAPVAVPVAAPAVVMEEGGAPPAGEGGMVGGLVGGPAGAPPRPFRERLIGVWAVDGSSSSLEIRDDGTLQVTKQEPGKNAVVEPLERWDVIEEVGTRLKIRRSRAGGIAVEQRVLFQDDTSFTLETADGAALYKRRAPRAVEE